MRNLSSKELRDSIKGAHEKNKKFVAYLPVGCMEQHGPFLPLETDSIIAEHISYASADRLSQHFAGYVFPLIYYTPSQSNARYCGTVSIPDNSFRIYVKEVCSSIMNSDCDALVLIAGHAGTESSLKEIGFWLVNEQYAAGLQRIRPVFTISIFEASAGLEEKFGQKSGRHADWREFLLLYRILGSVFFDETKMDALKAFQDAHSFEIMSTRIYGVPMEYRSVEGVLGDPLLHGDNDWEKISAEFWDFLIENLAHTISTELKNFWSGSFASG